MAPTPPNTGGMHPQTAIAMGQLMQRLAGNPKTRQRALGLVREIDPTYRLPADVAIADLEARQDAKREQERQEAAKAQRANRYKSQRKKLADSGYTEEQIKAIEDGVLKKYPHLELEDAAKLHAADDTTVVASRQRPPPQGRHGQHWEFPNIPGLLENPDKAATDMAYAVIDELRGRAA